MKYYIEELCWERGCLDHALLRLVLAGSQSQMTQRLSSPVQAKRTVEMWQGCSMCICICMYVCMYVYAPITIRKATCSDQMLR